jgi:hypothetical protein
MTVVLGRQLEYSTTGDSVFGHGLLLAVLALSNAFPVSSAKKIKTE